MDCDDLRHRRAALRKLGEIARALLRECTQAQDPALTPDEASKGEIAAACLIRHATLLEQQARRTQAA